ncbi:MAG: SprT family zinc-dependent metalloprotease [Candidatus Moranbacteria bacterium]|nr:SprT family zinc-dependent metalloprotease [Candidatus Moranbacteria bacterium]
MQKQIILQNEKVEYSLRESARARCLRVTIYPGGELAATLPRNFSLEQLESFLRQKADWILRKMNLAKKRKPSMVLPKASRREYLARKKEAFELVENKIDYFRAIYNLCPARISIRNQKTRWGSCSRKGNLNFNYRIVHLPEKYLDYVVVHELCHLKQFNHSKRFWDLVAEAVPDFKKIRKEIRNL